MKFRIKKTWLPWVLTALVAVIWGGVELSRSYKWNLKPLTAERLSAAKALWLTKGPQAYEMDVSITGAQKAEHHIVVKGGFVSEMFTDGKPASKHSLEYWNVNGMMTFLSEELAQAKEPVWAFGTQDPKEVYLSAEFDSTYGYPTHYVRQVFGRPLLIEWQVKNFRPVG